MLAALDHNFHAFRKELRNSGGESRYKKIYSKRSKNWRVELVKEPKKYPHWPLLAAKILHKRATDKETILRPMTVQSDHPQRLAATIAMKEAPSTKELVEAKLSRFSKKPASK